MCSICGGSVCAGTGGCGVVVQHAPEVVKITYSYTGSLLSSIQTYSAAVFTATKEQLKNITTYLHMKQ